MLNDHQLKSPCLYCPPNHLDKGKSLSLLQRVQGCCSLLIIVHDKNLEFTTKLRVVTCYLLILIYYLVVEFHTVHTFYRLSTYSNLSTNYQLLSCPLSLSSVLCPSSCVLCLGTFPGLSSLCFFVLSSFIFPGLFSLIL